MSELADFDYPERMTQTEMHIAALEQQLAESKSRQHLSDLNYDALEKQLAAAQQEREIYQVAQETALKEVAELTRERDALKAELDRVREALKNALGNLEAIQWEPTTTVRHDVVDDAKAALTPKEPAIA